MNNDILTPKLPIFTTEIKCPNCGCDITYHRLNNCPDCNQLINWEIEDDVWNKFWDEQ